MYHHSENQLTVYDYISPFREFLDPDNRWVKLADQLDWAALEQTYATHFSPGGKQAIGVRCAFGSLVIRRALGVSDRQTVQLIRESPYLQFFIGLPTFGNEVPFSYRSMAAFRARIPARQVNRAVRMLKTK